MRSAAPRLVVSVHDVAPATAVESMRWTEDLDRRGVPASLLVVPGPWRGRSLADEPEFAAWLGERAASGHELCLHGWDHTAALVQPRGREITGSFLARGCAEFWSLSEDESIERVTKGLDVLVGHGLATTGFTPPGWLASSSAIRGLRRAGISYTTSHGSVTDLRTQQRLLVPVICHRPHSRSERAGASLMRCAPPIAASLGRTFRVALHPDDLLRPGLRAAAMAGIDAAITAGATAVTYQTLLAEARATSSLSHLRAASVGDRVDGGEEESERPERKAS